MLKDIKRHNRKAAHDHGSEESIQYKGQKWIQPSWSIDSLTDLKIQYNVYQNHSFFFFLFRNEQINSGNSCGNENELD